VGNIAKRVSFLATSEKKTKKMREEDSWAVAYSLA
jgi:hypothetical protein